MVELHNMKVTELKAMIRYYNIHVIVKGYSKLNKTELINLLNQYMDNGPTEITSRAINIPVPKASSPKQKIKSKSKMPVVNPAAEKPKPIEQPKAAAPIAERRVTRSQTK